MYKAHVRRRLMLLLFLAAGILSGLVAAAWLLVCVVFSPNGTRPMHIVIAFDQLANATTGGDADETISNRAGRLKKDTRWACILCKILEQLDKEHCNKSIGI